MNYTRLFRKGGGLAEAIACLEASEPVIVHVQWEEFHLNSARTEQGAKRMAEQVIAELRKVKQLSGAIVWTVHNQLPHKVPFNDAFLRIRSALAEVASRIVVHNAASIDMLTAQTGLSGDDRRLTVIPHPSYAGMYEPEGRAAAELRAQTGAAEPPFVLGFGAMRRQKGFDFMLDALDAPFAARHGLRLRLSGKGEEGAALQLAHAHRTDIDWRLDYVPQDEVPALFRSAACLVLPYRRVATSGVALLGLTLGGVIVAPRFPAFVELLPPGLRRFLYEPDDPASLRDVVSEVAALSPEESRAVRLEGLGVAEALHPSRISRALGEAYRAAAQEMRFAAEDARHESLDA
ncbi:glycosyltransferase involved in cell wall biosynthesis [Methylopila jiangsuensis]|uniref:glycosyltransferase n=1 Tax=Methylopila jiangsuensis TaxID=586230 RepID=UPI0022F3487D|nr:glycosyltransferase [Methylopila jiangsuensis]MDR6284805.1 glycosyltransferase involved in cell wall biosynthesis [Methylopila jiangsuensis]